MADASRPPVLLSPFLLIFGGGTCDFLLAHKSLRIKAMSKPPAQLWLSYEAVLASQVCVELSDGRRLRRRPRRPGTALPGIAPPGEAALESLVEAKGFYSCSLPNGRYVLNLEAAGPAVAPFSSVRRESVFRSKFPLYVNEQRDRVYCS